MTIELLQVSGQGSVLLGSQIFGKSSPPEKRLVDYISVGGAHACGIIYPSGEVFCWGLSDDGQTGVPANVSFNEISAGFSHTCAVTRNGKVMCWGRNEYGQCSPPSGTGYLGVCAGTTHSCALHENRSITCFGGDHRRQSQVPDEVRRVQAERVLCGPAHTCVLSTLGELLCFGEGEPILRSSDGGLVADQCPVSGASHPHWITKYQRNCSDSNCTDFTETPSPVSLNFGSCHDNATVAFVPYRVLNHASVGWNYACAADRW
eukprot:CAMPEP_0184298666 /NCGR_PEP_ID=MMETSP1049-20130417/9430_1 /TAXON_ID=77928 /ORGANISM="Proteomonas sulcata, Strain CCMP704" /LENGTH=261 /DNA_ID=CAMNT_0026608867 /DNA_START=261 /DNA_END=1044 /DNA_ORIENTATION=-